MQTEKNAGLYEWLNQLYDKANCQTKVNLYSQLNDKIEQELPLYYEFFSFLNQKMPFFLTVASKLNEKLEAPQIVGEYQKYDWSEVDKYVQNFLLTLDNSGSFFKIYEKLKQSQILKPIPHEVWEVDPRYLGYASSVAKSDEILVFLTNTIVDAVQVIHELTHYLIVHPDKQIDYFYTESNATLVTLNFIEWMKQESCYQDLQKYLAQEIKVLMGKSYEFENYGTYLDVYLKNGQVTEETLKKYCEEYGMADLFSYFDEGVQEAVSNISIDSLIKHIRYLYACPLAYLKNCEDFDLLSFLSQYQKTTSFEEVARLFGTSYPLKDSELDEILKPFISSNHQITLGKTI